MRRRKLFSTYKMCTLSREIRQWIYIVAGAMAAYRSIPEFREFVINLKYKIGQFFNRFKHA